MPTRTSPSPSAAFSQNSSRAWACSSFLRSRIRGGHECLVKRQCVFRVPTFLGVVFKRLRPPFATRFGGWGRMLSRRFRGSRLRLIVRGIVVGISLRGLRRLRLYSGLGCRRGCGGSGLSQGLPDPRSDFLDSRRRAHTIVLGSVSVRCPKGAVRSAARGHARADMVHARASPKTGRRNIELPTNRVNWFHMSGPYELRHEWTEIQREMLPHSRPDPQDDFYRSR